MNHLMLFEQFSAMNYPKNYKQENAIQSLNNRSLYDYEYDASGDTEYTKKIHEFLTNNGYEYNLGKSKDYFYFTDLIPAGEVRGYKNAKISSVSISCDDEVVFNILFDIENPQHEEIERLKAKRDNYKKIKDEDWKDVEDEFMELLNKIRDIDVYIANFSYAYSQSVSPDVIKTVYHEMTKPANIERSEHISNLNSKIRAARYKIENLTYPEKIEYWDLVDELGDLTQYLTPSEADLIARKNRREKSEEDYNKEQDIAREILKGIL